MTNRFDGGVFQQNQISRLTPHTALEVCGYTGSAATYLLGVRPSAVYRATQRGRTARGRWERVLRVGETEKNIRKQRPL